MVSSNLKDTVKSLPFLMIYPTLLACFEEKNDLFRHLFKGKRNGTLKSLLLVGFD